MSILIALGFMTSCVSDIEDSACQITGSVNDKTTGEPVSAVSVTLSPGGKSTVTGSDGVFEFVNINPDNYTITISKDGYAPATKECTVGNGQSIETHMLIERIPAEITSDKSSLDFGEDLSTLSFKLVNRSYQDLRYTVETGDCRWLSVDPQNDVLAYGKTATVLVKVDRSLLTIGENKAIIVVRSSNGGGNTEVKVTAIRNDNTSAVNTLAADEITHNSARLNGEIISEGKPPYSERGFVWHTKNEMSLSNCVGKLSVAVNSNTKYSCNISNLNSATTYYARAYVIQDGNVIYGNVISFGAGVRPAKISTSAASSVTASTATLHASITDEGAPAYTERGFCYVLGDSEPTVTNNRNKVTGSGTGSYSLNLTGLSYPKKYTVRAYLVQNGEVIYGNSITFNTSVSGTALTASAATNVTASTATLNASITAVGQPAYSERGFCYTINSYSTPTIQNNRKRVDGSGIAGAFSLNLTNLDYNTSYRVRAYAIQDGEPVYSNEITFTTNFVAASVTTNVATNVGENSVRLNGMVTNVGDPKYTRRGFCYSYSNSNPTINDGYVFENNNIQGSYYKDVSGLQAGKTYYARAYVVQEGTTIYGNVVSFTTVSSPVLYTNSVTNIKGVDAGAGIILSYNATFNGYIQSAGSPAYTERGFVYDVYSQPRVGSGTKVTVSGSGVGAYSKNVTNLNTYKTYYVRAYVKTSSGYVYGDEVSFQTY